MSKYYTPDLSEFYVGFWYEIRTKGMLEYVESMYNEDDFNEGAFREGTEFRVKYLDRADIESFGFSPIIPNGAHENYEPTVWRMANMAIFALNEHNPDNHVQIQIGDAESPKYIMNFIIKNKSELSKILKSITE